MFSYKINYILLINTLEKFANSHVRLLFEHYIEGIYIPPFRSKNHFVHFLVLRMLLHQRVTVEIVFMTVVDGCTQYRDISFYLM